MIPRGRLGLIAKKAENSEIVCDIGTDHAYVPIYLAKQGHCKKAVGTDIRRGPVDIARRNIKKYGLEDLVETRNGYGLEPIRNGELDTVIIAGMGGMLIKEILQQGFEKAKRAQKLILQPMNGVEIVREWLFQNGFSVLDEELVSENGKLYNVIITRWTDREVELRKIYYIIGEKLIENKDPLLKHYIEKKIKRLDKAITGLKMSKGGEIRTEEYLKVKDELHYLMKGVDSNDSQM